MNTLKVSEVFGPTIQGEGPLMGRRCHFIRLYGCNNKCDFCDSKYSWHGSSRPKKVKVIELIDWLEKRHVKTLVLTGGEPLLQFGSAMVQLLHYCTTHNVRVQLETSGNISKIITNHERFTECLAAVITVISPKHINGQYRVNTLIARYAHAFKFVCEGHPSEADEIHWWLKKMSVFRMPQRVWLMPKGATRQEQLERMPAVAKLAIDNGWDFSARIHTLIWDNKRGV